MDKKERCKIPKKIDNDRWTHFEVLLWKRWIRLFSIGGQCTTIPSIATKAYFDIKKTSWNGRLLNLFFCLFWFYFSNHVYLNTFRWNFDRKCGIINFCNLTHIWVKTPRWTVQIEFNVRSWYLYMGIRSRVLFVWNQILSETNSFVRNENSFHWHYEFEYKFLLHPLFDMFIDTFRFIWLVYLYFYHWSPPPMWLKSITCFSHAFTWIFLSFIRISSNTEQFYFKYMFFSKHIIRIVARQGKGWEKNFNHNVFGANMPNIRVLTWNIHCIYTSALLCGCKKFIVWIFLYKFLCLKTSQKHSQT